MRKQNLGGNLGADWYRFALKEIIQSTKKMTDWEAKFFSSIKPRIEMGISLTERQEESLLKLHQRMTEIKRVGRW